MNAPAEVATPVTTPDGRELEEVRGWVKTEAGDFYANSWCTWAAMTEAQQRTLNWLRFVAWEIGAGRRNEGGISGSL